MELFRAVQLKLAARKRRERTHAPKSDKGFLKPLLYCAGCGRQMTCWTPKGRLKYRCQTYQLRYQNPGDKRYHTGCGVNAVNHDDIWAFLQRHVTILKSDLSHRHEREERTRLISELWDSRERFDEISGQGLFGYLNRLYQVFNLGEEHLDSQLGNEVLRLWDDGKDSDFKEIPADIKERIARIEVAKHTLASSALDQLQEQHRKLTLSFAMLTSERQQGVVAGELRRVESRMEELEGELTPILDRLDRIQDEQLALLDRLDDLQRQMKQSNNRAVGAALVEVFERIVLTFGSRDKAKPKKRHEPDTPWLKDETVFIYRNGDTRRIQDLDATRYEPDGSRSSSDRNLDSVHGSPRMW